MLSFAIFTLLCVLSNSVAYNQDICKLAILANKIAKSLANIKSTVSCATIKFPKDCDDILSDDPTSPDGVYTVYPADRKTPVTVYCDMTTEGGGWTVIQRRVNGIENFQQPWIKYATGFGNVTESFWLGNINIQSFTSSKNQTLRIDMKGSSGTTAYASYSIFSVGDMGHLFTLSVGGYNGTAGDSLSTNSGSKFSAMDLDEDQNSSVDCAGRYEGGWWYSDCGESNLNGHYSDTDPAHSIFWRSWKGEGDHLRYVEMKIRPGR